MFPSDAVGATHRQFRIISDRGNIELDEAKVESPSIYEEIRQLSEKITTLSQTIIRVERPP